MLQRFTRTKADHSTFVSFVWGLIPGVYIDEMLVVRSTAKEIEDVKRAITSEIKMSDLGPVSQLLVLKITCDISADKMFLSQVPDVEKILECFGMQQAKGIDTLMVK